MFCVEVAAVVAWNDIGNGGRYFFGSAFVADSLTECLVVDILVKGMEVMGKLCIVGPAERMLHGV